MSNTENKNKGGRPQKYPGEDPIRIGALIRPRYKEAIELVARDRGCTLGEAIEFCIAKATRDYAIDDQTILDMVRPKNEILSLLYKASFFDFYNPESTDHNFRKLGLYQASFWSHLDQMELEDTVEKLNKTPERFRTRLEEYILRVLETPLEITDPSAKEFFIDRAKTIIGKDKVNATFALYSRYFLQEKFILAVEEAWKEGMSSDDFVDLACIILNLNMYDCLEDVFIDIKAQNIEKELGRKLQIEEISELKENKKLIVKNNNTNLTYYSSIPEFERIQYYIAAIFIDPKPSSNDAIKIKRSVSNEVPAPPSSTSP